MANTLLDTINRMNNYKKFIEIVKTQTKMSVKKFKLDMYVKVGNDLKVYEVFNKKNDDRIAVVDMNIISVQDLKTLGVEIVEE